MNNNMKNEKDLFASFQYIRLMHDLDFITLQIQKNQYPDSDSRDGVIKKYITNPIKGLVKEKNDTKHNQDRDTVLKQIEIFRENNKNNNYNLFYDNKLEAVLKEVFKFDKYDSQIYLFGIQLTIDNEYEYIYREGSNEKISLILFKNKNTLNEMFEKFKKHYLVLAKQPLSSKQKWILAGTAGAVLFAAFALPVAAIGGATAAAPITTAALAGIGFADMQIGVGMIGLLTFLIGGSIMGATYKALDSYNKGEVKREFRKMEFKQVAQLFSIVLMRIDHAQKTMSNVVFKEYVSEYMQTVEDFKSDTNYVLFVERMNVVMNKEKLNIFHNFDKELMKVLAV